MIEDVSGWMVDNNDRVKLVIRCMDYLWQIQYRCDQSNNQVLGSGKVRGNGVML